MTPDQPDPAPVHRPAEPARPAAVPRRTLHMVGNSHLDPVWLWPWQEGYQEARATFWSAIHRMAEYPDFVFTCNQVVLLSWIEESDPDLFEQIRKRVVEGRWVMAGGWWVEPDCNLPGGESFVRQGLYGQRYLRERFGVITTVGMNVDPFGHSAMLPAILRGQRMDSYVFMRPGPHESELEKTAFWWEAPDGSRVLAYRIPFEYSSPPGDIGYQTEKALGQLDPALDDAMIFYGVGNHGGGPTKANIESIRRHDRMGSFGHMVMSTPRRYFDELLARDGSDGSSRFPVWRDDLQHHAPGCYSAHSGIKLWVRRAQAALLSAERWAAIGAVAHGLDYPRTELEAAWKHLLFNQFHDVLPGSAVESAYDDARDQLGAATASAKRIITRTHNVIARDVDVPFEPGTQPVVVFNHHPWPVTADIELQYRLAPSVHVVDADGRPTPSQPVQSTATTTDPSRGAVVFQADLPPLGFRLYRLRSGSAPADASWSGQPPGLLRAASETLLENDILRAEFDPATGWLVSLLDKRSGVDVVAGARGEHTQVSEDPSDTWGHRVVSYAWPGEPMRLTRIVLREAGPHRARLRVEREWGKSTLVEEFTLRQGADQLEARITIDWREQGRLLKLRFPTALAEPTATYEIPFGALERPVDGAEEPGQSWVDLSGTVNGPAGHRPAHAGLAVINNAKHGYDVSPIADDGSASPSIGITAVRSPVYAWHDPRMLDDDGIYAFQDQGPQTFSYLLVPHVGDWRTAGLARRAAELASRPRAMTESFHEGELPPQASYVADGGDQIMVTAVKGWEDGGVNPDLIVRAVETTGAAGSARLELPLVGRVIEADFGPYQLRTFRVPRDADQPIVEVDLLEWAADEGAA